MKPITDVEIIRSIQAGGRDAEGALRYICAEGGFRRLADLAARRFDGSRQDADDIFQEGLWRLYQKIKDGDFEEKSSLKTFFGSICQNISLNEYAKRKRQSSHQTIIASSSEVTLFEPEALLWKDKTALLEKPLSALGQKCKTVLEYWAVGYAMKEIAELLDLKDETAAKSKKKNCLNSLRVWMKNHPEDANCLKEGL